MEKSENRFKLARTVYNCYKVTGKHAVSVIVLCNSYTEKAWISYKVKYYKYQNSYDRNGKLSET